MWSAAFGLILIYVNCKSVANFGSFEYWFALIKVAAIMAFIVIGLAHVRHRHRPSAGRHAHGTGGRFHAARLGGVDGRADGDLLVLRRGDRGRDLGRGGKPKQAIPHALKSMVLRRLFYVLALGIMVAYLPWTEAGAKVVQQSPFVKLFAHAGIAQAAGIMNFVVITAALSSMNTNIYLSSRMLFSLSRGGMRRASSASSPPPPLRATLISGAGVLATTSVSFFSPHAYNYLFGVALFGGIFVWIMILVTHLRFRRAWRARRSAAHAVFPIAQITGIALLVESWSRWGWTPSSGTSRGSSACHG